MREKAFARLVLRRLLDRVPDPLGSRRSCPGYPTSPSRVLVRLLIATCGRMGQRRTLELLEFRASSRRKAAAFRPAPGQVEGSPPSSDRSACRILSRPQKNSREQPKRPSVPYRGPGPGGRKTHRASPGPEDEGGARGTPSLKAAQHRARALLLPPHRAIARVDFVLSRD